jgi:hypothetical protein
MAMMMQRDTVVAADHLFAQPLCHAHADLDIFKSVEVVGVKTADGIEIHFAAHQCCAGYGRNLLW